MALLPLKDEYRLGDVLGLNCKQTGLFPRPVGSFTCGPSLTWEPAPPADLRCSDGNAAAPTLPWVQLRGDLQLPCLLLQRRSPLFPTASVLPAGGGRDPSVCACGARAACEHLLAL